MIVILTLIAVLVILSGCNAPLKPGDEQQITFGVIDVGQGLCQILQQGNRALLFDTGPGDSAKNWLDRYRQLGSPHLEAVVLSHRDLDHTGGLVFLDTSVDWSGKLIAGSGEDTAFIRTCCKKWGGTITISTIVQGDSIRFTDDCIVRCYWPPALPPEEIPVPDELTNENSLVLGIHYLNTAVAVTGDIDSTGARKITGIYTTGLRADIVVVPHHGSASSVCPLLYGYCRPLTAVISCGENNSYGHPAPETIDMLNRQGIFTRITASNGSVFWKSSGFYWESGF